MKAAAFVARGGAPPCAKVSLKFLLLQKIHRNVTRVAQSLAIDYEFTSWTIEDLDSLAHVTGNFTVGGMGMGLQCGLANGNAAGKK